jgi:hypothetical protein
VTRKNIDSGSRAVQAWYPGRSEMPSAGLEGWASENETSWPLDVPVAFEPTPQIFRAGVVHGGQQAASGIPPWRAHGGEQLR